MDVDFHSVWTLSKVLHLLLHQIVLAVLNEDQVHRVSLHPLEILLALGLSVGLHQVFDNFLYVDEKVLADVHRPDDFPLDEVDHLVNVVHRVDLAIFGYVQDVEILAEFVHKLIQFEGGAELRCVFRTEVTAGLFENPIRVNRTVVPEKVDHEENVMFFL